MRPDDQVALANQIARKIKSQIPATHGFCLFIFPHSTQPGQGMTTYIANVQRADMRQELRTVLAKWDADAIARGEKP